MAEVKGKILIGLIKYLQTQPGLTLEGLLTECPEAQPIYQRKLSGILWYPLVSLVQPMERMVRRLGQDSPAGYAAFGRWGAFYDVERSYKIIYRAAGDQEPIEMLKHCDMLWDDNYRGAGRMSCRDIAPDRCAIELSGWPEIPASLAFMLEGWIDASAKAVNAAFDIQTRLESSAHLGAPITRWRVTWRRKTAP